jgi:hypothetical protein
MFDFGAWTGDPDLASTAPTAGQLCATAVSATYAPPGGQVTPGGWFAQPSECGPYQAVTQGSATDTATVTTLAFDPAVTSDTGDLWPDLDVSPVTIAPGATATINLTITPSAAAGTVVTGTLYVDTEQDGVPPGDELTGSEVAALPYEYTVG